MNIKVDDAFLKKFKEAIIDYIGHIQTVESNYRLKARGVRERLGKIDSVIVTNLIERTGAAFKTNGTTIYVDKSFVEISTNGKKSVRFKEESWGYAAIGFLHELWHAASGMKDIDRKENVALTEGITQMLAERIKNGKLSFFVNPYYYHFTCFARILRLCFGQGVVVDYYLNNSENLGKVFNGVVKDDDAFTHFNQVLSNLFNLNNTLNCQNEISMVALDKVYGQYKKCLSQTYDNRIKEQYQWMIVHIVLPVMHKTDKRRRNAFRKEFLDIFTYNSSLQQEVKNWLDEYLPLEKEEAIRKQESKAKALRLDEKEEFITLFKNKGYHILQVIKVKDNGDIIYLKNDNEEILITDDDFKTLIYQELWLNENTRDSQTKEYLRRIRRGMEQLTFYTESIKEKRCQICGYQFFFEQGGYRLLNSFEEVDEVSTLEPLLLSKTNFPTEDELKKVSNHFQIVNVNDYKMVINSKTQKEVHDPFIITNVLFADLWFKMIKRCHIPMNDGVYEYLLRMMEEQMAKTGLLGIEELIHIHSNGCYNYFIRDLFEQREDCDIIRAFMFLYLRNAKKTIMATDINERSGKEFREKDPRVGEERKNII